VRPLHDVENVRAEYASEAGLAARAGIYQWADGPDAQQALFDAVAEVAPKRFLDVGCGRGALVQRVSEQLGAEVVGLDQSEHMVGLTRARGVGAVVGDAQGLPFADAAFDCVAAAWMLYHVPDVDRVLAEFARVLAPSGRLLAVTNGIDHMYELYDMLGRTRLESTFSDENGDELLRRHFSTVELVDLGGWVTFPSREEAQAYVDVSPWMWADDTHSLPPIDGQVRVRYRPLLFVATK
jgi:SAM-dependent methyltransferase